MLDNLVTPGDAAKDSLFTALGFSPAAFGHVEAGLFFGFLTLAVNIIFRAVELWLRYGSKGEKGKR